MRAWLRRPSSLMVLGGAAVTALGVFTLAWRLSPAFGPVTGMSYAVGYENWVAWVATLAGCGLAWAAGVLRRREDGGGVPDGPARASAETPPAPVPRLDVALLAGLTAVAFIAYAYATFGVPILDNVFFFLRIPSVLEGAVPWRDFGFPYGPLMIYAPAALSWLSSGLGAGPVLGYYVAAGLSLVAGVPLLAWVLRDWDVARARKRALFWIAGVYGLLGVAGGLNYTLVRFLAPIAGIVLVARVARRSPAVRPAVLGIVSLAIALGLALVSPELAIAYALASTALLYARRREVGAGWKEALAVQVIGLVAAAAVLGGLVAGVVSSFAEGAFAFPVLPSPYILLYLATAFMASFASGRRILSFGGSLPGAALVLAGLALVPAALGRADFSHVFWNGLPLFLAGGMVLGRSSASRFWAWAVAIAVAFTGWQGMYGVNTLRTVALAAVRADVMPRAVTEAFVSLAAPDKAETVREMYGPDPLQGAWTTARDRARLGRLEGVALPFGVNDTLAFMLAGRGELVTIDCDEKGPVSPSGMPAALRGLERADRVAVPVDLLPALESESADAALPLSRRPAFSGPYYTLLLQLPVDIPARRGPYAGRAALVKAVDESFEYEDVIGRYVVMERKR